MSSAISAITDQASTGVATSSTGATAASATKDEFMRLFIAQLEHQDPLSPQDSSAFLAQLAQMSQLEQTTATNEKLQALADAQAASARASLTDMVGRNVTATADAIEIRDSSTSLSSSGARLTVNLALASSKTTLDVKDAAGNVKKSIDLGPHAAGSISVDLSQLGALAAGAYTLSVSGKASDGTVTRGSAQITGVVDALQLGEAGGRFRIGPFNVTPASINSVGASAP